MFKRILVANRGEIALRIIRACRELGIETVAICSEADRGATYLDLADEVYCIGPPKAADSYLKVDRVISAAELGNVQAIHPGYGFLAENADFADVVRSCDIEFIGPTHQAMALVGDKNAARKLAKEVGVPTVPGSQGLIQGEAEAVQLARQLGFPVLIKASAGGGGRGMRVAVNELALKSAIAQAQAEAEAAFGNPGLYMEKFIDRPRHVEVQILADRFGTVVHLGERDCSIQRRHQKLLEEAPCPVLDADTRRRMGEAAVAAARSIRYEGAGTVEFLLDSSGAFYFMEMNTRIQVEHPVTEMITGVDLVKEQIRVAAGEELRHKDTPPMKGHVIECRINAEDPFRNFQPSPGKIEVFHLPGGNGVRVDTHAYAGYTVPPFYDSMIAKLIVHGDTRAEALAKMRLGLDTFIVQGVTTTIPFLSKVMSHPDFVRGDIHTKFLEVEGKDLFEE